MSSLTERVSEVLRQKGIEEQNRLQLELQRKERVLAGQKRTEEALAAQTRILHERSYGLYGLLWRSGAEEMLKELNKNFLNNKGEIYRGYDIYSCSLTYYVNEHYEYDNFKEGRYETTTRDHKHPIAVFGLTWKNKKDNQKKAVYIFAGLSNMSEIGVWTENRTHDAKSVVPTQTVESEKGDDTCFDEFAKGLIWRHGSKVNFNNMTLTEILTNGRVFLNSLQGPVARLFGQLL